MMDATVNDLDQGLLTQYKHILNAEHLPMEQVLKARGLMKTVEGRDKLTICSRFVICGKYHAVLS